MFSVALLRCKEASALTQLCFVLPDGGGVFNALILWNRFRRGTFHFIFSFCDYAFLVLLFNEWDKINYINYTEKCKRWRIMFSLLTSDSSSWINLCLMSPTLSPLLVCMSTHMLSIWYICSIEVCHHFLSDWWWSYILQQDAGAVSRDCNIS